MAMTMGNVFQTRTATTTATRTNGGISGRILARKCACGQHTGGSAECTDCRKRRGTSDAADLQRHISAHHHDSSVEAPAVIHEVLRSPGQLLDVPSRAYFEPKFGQDFSGVRVHTDARAAQSAESVNALAYTVGKNIVFGTNQYSPDTYAGRSLLAHELTHVIQQRGAGSSGGPLRVGSPDTALEAQAHANSAALTSGTFGALNTFPGAQLVQRDPAPIDKDKDVTPKLNIDQDAVDAALDIVLGRHKITFDSRLNQPLNLFGVNFLGIDNPQLIGSIGYENRCNSAMQSALIKIKDNIALGGTPFNFDTKSWQIGTQIGFRWGTVRFDPGATANFEGSQFNSIMFSLQITTGVDPSIPEICKGTPNKPIPDKPQDNKPDNTPDKDTGHPPNGGNPPNEAKPRLQPMTLYFYYDTSALREESKASFDILKQTLQTLPTVQVIFTGHASLEGTQDYNVKLGQRRADALKSLLVASGIETARIQTSSLGEEAPAVLEPDEPKHTIGDKLEKLRDQNRRVEVLFYDPTGQFASTVPDYQLSTPKIGTQKPWRMKQ